MLSQFLCLICTKFLPASSCFMSRQWGICSSWPLGGSRAVAPCNLVLPGESLWTVVLTLCDNRRLS